MTQTNQKKAEDYQIKLSTNPVDHVLRNTDENGLGFF